MYSNRSVFIQKMTSETIIFYLILLMISFLYSSVGQGGASGYLALMAFFSFAPEKMRQTALILSFFVSLTTFIKFYSRGYFQLRLFLPFAITSIPAAFLGGMLVVDTDLYNKVLGTLLLLSVLKILGFYPKSQLPIKKSNVLLSLFIGFAVGFISGLIGFGGGIILSPIILLMHWADSKHAAAVSSLFIIVNSISGLAGIFSEGINLNYEILFLVITAFTGGLAGSFFGSKKFSNEMLNEILALVIFIASLKLLIF